MNTVNTSLRYLVASIIMLIIVTNVNAIPPDPPTGFRWVLQGDFSDEFNGIRLDANKWFDHYPGWEGRPPARFEPKALSVNNGNLEIKSGVLDKKKGPYTIYGGGIVSKSKKAHFGYYECHVKASKIAMSTTFWLSNDKVPFEEGDCPNDSYSQELDIQEAVGGSTTYDKFVNGMNCNTHYRYIKCNERKETFISKGAGTTLKSAVYDDYHTYGAWWKNAEEVEFYADNKFFEMVKISKEISDKPFDRPMHVNMVTETYDWQPAPSTEDLNNDEINTAYYDWVRSYKLVPINDEYKHPKTDVDLYNSMVNISNVNTHIFETDKLLVDYSYSNNEEAKILVKIIEGNKKRTTMQEFKIQAYQGFGKATIEIPVTFKPVDGKNYRIEFQLLNKKNNVLDVVRYDVSR